jgi:hypothetical protein
MDMNIDQFKSDWQNDQPEKRLFTEADLKLKSSHSFIDRIRKNMKVEFILYFVSYIYVLFMLIFHGGSDMRKILAWLGFGVITMITIYYLAKFFIFYKKTKTMEYNSRENLLWFYYTMKINVEVYRSFYFILFTVSLFFGFIYGFFTHPNQSELDSISSTSTDLSITIWISIVLFFIVLTFSTVMMEIWLKMMYTKYIKKIEFILKELDSI